MVVRKRCLLWDWTNTRDVPRQMDKVDFNGPIHSVSNWNTWYPQELKHRAPFRPMIHDIAKISGGEWQNIANTKNGVIHFFNEPERAGISPETAAKIWVDQVIPLRRNGNKLVSPSCASDPNGQAWISKFMSLVHQHPPDYLGVHYYGTEASQAIKYFEDMYNKHGKHHLIISEIASISRNHAAVVAFTVDVANWADRTPWVSEYGFFGCMRRVADNFVSPEAQLMKPDGSFTPLMNKLMHEQPMHK